MSEWKQHKIADLIEQNLLLIGDGYRAKNSELYATSSTGIAFARVRNIDGGFDFSEVDFYPLENLSTVGAKISQVGDTVFTSKGTVGRFAFVTETTPQFVYSPQLCFWRTLDDTFIVPRFLFYWMQGGEFLAQVEAVKGQTDMADYVNLADQRQMKLTLPPLEEQQAIAVVLSSLDDKIDLLQRQNKTLEALAQTLFRHWFVDGAEDDWEECVITDLFEIRDGTHDSPKQRSLGKPLITSKHIKDFRLDFENAYLISDEDFIKISKRSKVEALDILFSMIGTVGLTYLEQSKHVEYAIKNVGLLKTSQNPAWVYYTYLWLNSSSGREFIYENKGGSTQEYISLGGLRSIVFVKPPEPVLQSFNAVIASLFRKIQINQEQICTLENLRDTLLPKLMSGEIRVCL